MENIELNRAIRHFFHQLSGNVCWSVIAGQGSGSMVSLAFGKKIKRLRPVRNPSLSPEQQIFDGEYVIFVKDSPWELRSGGTVICTSSDSNERNGRMLTGLQKLVGNRLVSSAITNGAGGLRLHFSGAFLLELKGVTSDVELKSYSLFVIGDTVADVGSSEH